MVDTINIIELIHGKPTSHILNGEELRTLPLRSATKPGGPHTIPIEHSAGSPNQRK
jgi:hypothetical protein